MELKRDGLLPLNLQLFAESGGESAGGEATPAGDGGNGTVTVTAEDLNGATPAGASNTEAEDVASLKAKIAQLEAKSAKDKAALDKATKEAGDARKALKAKMTQEEIDAANKQEADEKAAQHVAELERKVARIEATKSVMGNLGVDEATAGNIAESLVGCENVENALLLIKQAWDAKEKQLRIEFGKVPPPGAGGGSEDREKQEALKLAKELGQQRAGRRQSIRDQLQGLIR